MDIQGTHQHHGDVKQLLAVNQIQVSPELMKKVTVIYTMVNMKWFLIMKNSIMVTTSLVNIITTPDLKVGG